MSEDGKLPLTTILGVGALGGAVVGLQESLTLLFTGRLGVGFVGAAALLLAGAATGALVAVAPVGTLVAVPALRRRRPLWAGLLGGASALAMRLGLVVEPTALWIGLAVGTPFLVAVAGMVADRRHPRGGQAVVATLVAFGLAASVMGRPEATASRAASLERPNLLLVTVSAARADRFGAFRIDTAGFDRLSAEGVSFAVATSPAPADRPSHASMMSGRPPWEHGVFSDSDVLGEDVDVVAERLAARGYATGAFVSSEALDRSSGLDRGFAVYDDDLVWVKGLDRVTTGRLWGRLTGRTAPTERRAGDTVERALRYIGSRSGAWFVWVHLGDPVGPYAPPPPFDTRYYGGHDPRGEQHRGLVGAILPEWWQDSWEGVTDASWVSARYDGEVAYADAELARLLTALDDDRQTGATLVAVAGAYGEGLGDGEQWFGHAGGLSDGVIRVPLGLRLPGRIPAGETVASPVELCDLGPTLLDYLGAHELEGASGVSLKATVQGEGVARRMARSVQARADARAVALRMPGALIVHDPAETDQAWSFPAEVGPDDQWTEARLSRVLDLAMELDGVEGGQATPQERAGLLEALRPAAVAPLEPHPER